MAFQLRGLLILTTSIQLVASMTTEMKEEFTGIICDV